MQKVKFMMPQPELKVCPEEGELRYFICENENIVVEPEHMEGEELIPAVTYYEYDYHEFVAPESLRPMVMANPASFLTYESPKPQSTEEKLVALMAENEVLTGCLLELSEILYA